jgi:hypothetical protein
LLRISPPESVQICAAEKSPALPAYLYFDVIVTYCSIDFSVYKIGFETTFKLIGFFRIGMATLPALSVVKYPLLLKLF